MFDLYSLWDKVKSAFSIGKHPLCKHTFAYKNQVWDRIANKRFTLKDHYVCKTCGDDKLTLPGEK